MIVFREKQYSSVTTKTIHGVKKTVNSIKPSVKKKSSYELKKSAVAASKKIKRKKNAAGYVLNDVVQNPGNYIGDKVVKPTVEAPVTGLLSKVVPIPGATATQITVLAPIEKRMYPKRVRVGLEKAANWAGTKAKHAFNAAGELFRHNPGAFIPGL